MKPKQLPRLWCAMQGLLPLEDCLAAQEAELAWPRSGVAAASASASAGSASPAAVEPKTDARPPSARDRGARPGNAAD